MLLVMPHHHRRQAPFRRSGAAVVPADGTTVRAARRPPRFSEKGLNERAGVTLIEVLVAIFIMGIGLLALLTLFPLGALRMAKAIQDDRAA